MADEETPTCQGCGRSNPVPARVHEGCRNRYATMLAELPALADNLITALVPGGTARSDGTKHRKPDAAPLGINLAAFSLLSAGCFDFNPGETAHQTGPIPLRVWVDAWYDDFADRYGFGPVVVPDRTAPEGSPGLMRSLLTSSKLVVETFVGVGDGHVIMRPISDTLEAEYAARFGRPQLGWLHDAVAALASRFDEACDTHPDIGDFLNGLRIMVGACRSVLGEHSDLVHIGSCPERRRNRETGMEESCGGAIWQDPYVKRIVCPRCKMEWQERAWLKLGKQIRDRAPDTTAAHEFVGELVVIEANDKVKPKILADRWWSVACTCGQWLNEDGEAVKVRGNKLDARGQWRLHVEAATAPMVEILAEAS